MTTPGREGNAPPIDKNPATSYLSAVPTLGRLLCLLAALAVIEGPYLVMQGYAWATMVRDRAPELGFEAAVADTLSGEHPCPKCLALTGEREKKNEQAPVDDCRQLCLLAPAGHHRSWSRFLTQRPPLPAPAEARLPAPSRSEDVPTPPPRVG